MKYSLIELRKNHINGEFVIYSKELPYERHTEKTTPKPVGFYYFPSSKPKQIAFEELKQCMIDKLNEEIKERQNSIKQLKRVTYEP